MGVLIAVMKVDSHELGRKHLFKSDWVVATHQKDVLVHEATLGLLGHFKSCKRFAVDELAGRVDWLVPRLSLERDILAAYQVDLQRI